MPIDAFLHLNKLRTLMQSGQALCENEPGEIKAILSSVLKRRFYAQWRKEEATRRIILDPSELFSMEGNLPANQSEEWLTWRFDPKARKRWLQTLEARSAQLEAINDGLKNAVVKAEESALPILREGLIDAAYDKHFPNGAGEDPNAPPSDATPERLQEYRARWVTNYFLIDAETGTCRKTTRLQQTIETLQMILWSARTGMLQDTYPEIKIKLLADDFDEDWKWIGSYATWRAAMFMFLYPENILLPTLRKPGKQTPGFKKLVEGLRSEPTLTPKKARELAREYSNYYRDVCNLTIEATCEVKGFTSPMEEHTTTGETSNPTNLLFIFGRAQDRVFFSISSCANESGTHQTLWHKVPGMETNIKQVFETGTFDVHNEHAYLYIFAKKWENGKDELVFSRYDLETNEWDGNECHILETPFEEVSNCLIDQSGNIPLTLLIKGQKALSPIEGKASLTLSYSSIIANLDSNGLCLEDNYVVPVQGIWGNPRGFHMLQDSRVLIFHEWGSKIIANQFLKLFLEYVD
ncbi:MAG: hypothetical protein K8S18_12725 [Desulfobacula sp.]|nr:hypothetical protein [Desulfobacula sp.]